MNEKAMQEAREKFMENVSTLVRTRFESGMSMTWDEYERLCNAGINAHERHLLHQLLDPHALCELARQYCRQSCPDLPQWQLPHDIDDSIIREIIPLLVASLGKKKNDESFVKAMIGASVCYEALPYEMGTPEYERLKTVDSAILDAWGGHTRYILDEQAVRDFITFWGITRGG